MTGKTPLLARVSYGLSTALLALSFAFGVSAVRAESDTLAPSWGEMLIDPIMKSLLAVEERLASLEATVAGLAGSFTSQQITARQLCVSDDAGAETCITKAQLDAVLASMARAAAIEPSATVTEVTAAAPVEPAEASEPSAIAIEATAPALVEPAEVDEPLVTVTEASALVEPAEETTGVASLAPAAMAEEIAPREQEPAHTNSVSLPSSGAALVWHPEVEVSIPAPVPSSD